jgi:hypothetical protein
MRRALLAGTLLLGAACRPAPPPTRFLNFDPASGAEALREGWSSFERGADGSTYVWAAAREARIVTQQSADSDLLVVFLCWPFWYQGAPEQTIGLSVNGTVAETVRLSPDRRVYTVYVRRDLWRAGENELTFAFAYVARPLDHGKGADDRTLAAAFDWLEIVPPPRPR